jgi:hypothetical protein
MNCLGVGMWRARGKWLCSLPKSIIERILS